jgi:hypothetical protein
MVLALQLAVLPPLVPAHVRVHGSFPLTDDAVPAEHKLLVGLDVVVVAALPHFPLTAAACL